MRLSVVITYYNRPEQFDNTLRSIYAQDFPNLELIVVDDASDKGMDARQVLEDWDVSATLIEITKEEKHWANPSVSYNRGFAEITGDVAVIQNAETLHVGPVLRQIQAGVTAKNYMVCSCYSSTEEEFRKFKHTVDYDAVVQPHKADRWYHHPTLFPKWYHFCSAMTTENLQRLGGFNEAFAAGYCFEDDEFLLRIRKRARLSVEPVHGAYVIHQWHPKNPALCGGCEFWERNRKLYAKIEESLR
jgi:cellulose synthase/poly-beta-1,6-N-acetylglucosamine synthase-like glycosyltransferase